MFLGSDIAASDEAEQQADDIPARPSIMFNRWQEDWSVLADPRVPREPLDSLKYIPLAADDPEWYLSFGANLRERFEANNASGFATGPNHNADYDISRFEVFANVRLGPNFQFFTELQSDYAGRLKFLSANESEIAELLGLTERTVQRDWRKARMLLGVALG